MHQSLLNFKSRNRAVHRLEFLTLPEDNWKNWVKTSNLKQIVKSNINFRRQTKITTKKKLSKMKKLSCYEQFKVFIMILPTMLGLMAAMDVLFMAFNLLIFAFMVIFICFPIRDKVHHFHEDWHNRFFMYCFGMSVMDVRGFKC